MIRCSPGWNGRKDNLHMSKGCPEGGEARGDPFLSIGSQGEKVSKKVCTLTTEREKGCKSVLTTEMVTTVLVALNRKSRDQGKDSLRVTQVSDATSEKSGWSLGKILEERERSFGSIKCPMSC